MREGRVGLGVRVVACAAKPGVGEIGYTTIGILSAGALQNWPCYKGIYSEKARRGSDRNLLPMRAGPSETRETVRLRNAFHYQLSNFAHQCCVLQHLGVKSMKSIK